MSKDPLADLDSGCALPNAARDARVAQLEEEWRAHRIATRVLDGGRCVELVFPASAATRERLEAVAEFERGCCGGQQWRVFEAEHAGAAVVVLGVSGLPPGSKVLERLGVAPQDAPAEQSVGRSLFASLGIGTGFALVVCCLLPALGALLFGGAVASGLTALDQPPAIAAVGAIVACASWFARRRRQRAQRMREAT